MPRDWILLDQPAESVLSDLPAPAVIRKILWQRGLRETEPARQFLRPSYPEHLHDPFVYRGMPLAVDRLVQAIQRGERITVYGDYDADGICATAIMVETLQALGAQVDWYVPERLAEGYGLNVAAISDLAQQGTQVLVTVDCGTTNTEEIAHANHLGLNVIVLDHHQAATTEPAAVAIINPNLANQSYPFAGHSSGGVALTVARALLQATADGQTLGRPLGPAWEKRLLDLVAISTVADMMLLQGENRVLVRAGLQVLRKNRRAGLKALFTIMGSPPAQATETTIGYQISPRLNAAGRLQHASTALRLLLTTNPLEAAALATELQSVNAQRQRLTELAVAEALEQLERQGDQSGYVAYAPHWSPGIVGLIAGRLVERVWRPVLVMTDNGERVVGSGRSIPGFDITAHLRTGEQHLLRFGGHAGACGFTLTRRDGREVFQAWFQSSVRDVLTTETQAKPLTIDVAVGLDEVTPETVNSLEQLSPYGIGHERPKFLLSDLRVLEATTVGASGQHVRFQAQQGDQIAKFIAFSAADRIEVLRQGNIDAVAEIGWNEWNGQRSIQFKIIDFRPSRAPHDNSENDHHE